MIAAITATFMAWVASTLDNQTNGTATWHQVPLNGRPRYSIFLAFSHNAAALQHSIFSVGRVAFCGKAYLGPRSWALLDRAPRLARAVANCLARCPSCSPRVSFRWRRLTARRAAESRTGS